MVLGPIMDDWSRFWKQRWKPQMWRETFLPKKEFMEVMQMFVFSCGCCSPSIYAQNISSTIQHSYLWSSASELWSTSSQNVEGRYRWSSETLVAPACPWPACLSLMQGVVGDSGGAVTVSATVLRANGHILAADVIYSLPTMKTQQNILGF